MSEAKEDKDPFEDIEDHELIEECQERGIWNEESSIDDYSTDELMTELDDRRRAEPDTVYHRARAVMRTGDRNALWELMRTEVQDFLGVIVQ